VHLLEELKDHINLQKQMDDVNQMRKAKMFHPRHCSVLEKIQQAKDSHIQNMNILESAFSDVIEMKKMMTGGAEGGGLAHIHQHQYHNSLLQNQHHIHLNDDEPNRVSYHQQHYKSREENINYKLGDTKMRIEVLDRALLRNFYYDDLKEKEDELFKEVRKQGQIFNHKLYNKRKEELRNWLQKQKSQ